MKAELYLLSASIFMMVLTAVVAVYLGPFPLILASILWIAGALIPAITIFVILVQMIFRWFPVRKRRPLR